jgi:hypothetical protein
MTRVMSGRAVRAAVDPRSFVRRHGFNAYSPLIVSLALALAGAGCSQCADFKASPPVGTNDPSSAPVTPVPVGSIPGHGALAQDTAPKEGPRLMAPESLIRSYLSLFGSLSPLDLQQTLRQGGAGLFDTWNDYLASLGLPDHRIDIPRNTQTSPIMLATFERVGIALCDKALERDLRGTTPIPDRLIFAFAPTTATPTDDELTARIDTLHRTFLGYPLALGPPERPARFRELFRQVASRRASQDGGPRYTFTPAEAGYAALCYAFIRHPEIHLY